jgi:CRISPR-associated protein Cas1
MAILYVTEERACLKVKHQQFQVYREGVLEISVPVNQVSHVVLFGSGALSHGAVNLALRRQIPVMFLSGRGRYFGRLQGETAEIDYLIRQVHRSRDQEFTLRQAKSIVEAKRHNSQILLRRLNRRRRNESVIEAIATLGDWREKIQTAPSVESLLGCEGQCARVYFEALGRLIQPPFAFDKRTRRPPADPVNSLLSLGYTLVSQNIYSLVGSLGLNPHFGHLHTPRDNHPALVSDLVEEFRAPLVDSLVVSLINGRIFQVDDFTPPDARGGVYLTSKALKIFLKHWQQKLQSEITHPYTKTKVTYYRCFELQIGEYIACLLGEREVYRPLQSPNKW